MEQNEIQLIDAYRKLNTEGKAKLFLKAVSIYNAKNHIDDDFELCTDKDEIDLIRNYFMYFLSMRIIYITRN